MEEVKSYGGYETLGDSNLSSVHSKFDYTDFNSDNGTGNFSNGGTPTTTNSTSAGRDEFLAKIEQSVLTLIFTLTILGNFLVLMGIYFRKQKMTRMYYFILHLSIADLTTAFFNVLTQLFWEITYRFQGGAFMCKFVKYTQILGPYSSSYILVMTALDRYQAICFPLSNCSWTARRSKVMLGTAWVLSFVFCLPQLYIFNYQDIGTGVFDCWGTFEPNWGEKAYITWYCITVFIVPLIILIFAYTCITRAIWLNFSMKNAVIKEERTSRGLSKVDSEDMDDQSVDHTMDENASSVGHEKNKNGKKHLEVSWHHKKQGTKTKASLSQHVALSKSLPLSSTHGQSFSESQNNHDKRLSISPKSRFFENGHMRNMNQCVEDKQKHELSTSSIENHSNGGGIHVHDMNYGDGANLASEKRRNWKTMSSKFDRKKNSDASFTQDHENNDDFQKKSQTDSKRLLLSPFDQGNRKSFEVSRTFTSSIRSSNNIHNQPRTHSVKGISRAKIKTVKLTVTVICCYIICSTPFIAALLWSAFDPYAKEHPFFYGPTFTILTLLASLNSCANAWIVLFFNPNLLQSFYQGICRRKSQYADRQSLGGPVSMNVSQRKLNNKNSLSTNSNNLMATSVTALSPLMNRLSKNENSTKLSKNGGDQMEILPVVDTTKSGFLSSQNRNYHTDGNKRDGSSIPVETSFIGI